MVVGSHLIKSWSRTQDGAALSSAEAELVALGKLAMEMLGVRSMMHEWNMASAGNLAFAMPMHRRP